jgi:hypothetical protein
MQQLPIQLLHGHPAEMRDLDGSRRHCRMAQARLARIHQAALARTKSFVDQVTLSADSGLYKLRLAALPNSQVSMASGA